MKQHFSLYRWHIYNAFYEAVFWNGCVVSPRLRFAVFAILTKNLNTTTAHILPKDKIFLLHVARCWLLKTTEHQPRAMAWPCGNQINASITNGTMQLQSPTGALEIGLLKYEQSLRRNPFGSNKIKQPTRFFQAFWVVRVALAVTCSMGR